MRNLIVIVLAVCCAKLFGQKIDGVYYGAIFSPKNSMVVKGNGEQVNGIIYLNEKDTLHFSGVCSSATVRATVHVKDQVKVELEGRVEESAMWIRILPDSDRRFLNKVSSKPNYKVKRLYLEDMDARLLGKWEGIRSVTKDGVKEAKVTFTYFDNGTMFMQLLAIPPGVRRREGMSDANILSQKMEQSWTANGYELTMTLMLPHNNNNNSAATSRLPSPPPTVSKYIVTHDTLTIYGSNGGYTVFKKK